MSSIGFRAILTGVVQGVGFRYWCCRKAQEFGICGYVANLPDGSVEVHAEGNRGILEEFIKILKVGPAYAKVENIKLQWIDKSLDYNNFSVKYKD